MLSFGFDFYFKINLGFPCLLEGLRCMWLLLFQGDLLLLSSESNTSYKDDSEICTPVRSIVMIED